MYVHIWNWVGRLAMVNGGDILPGNKLGQRGNRKQWYNSRRVIV